MKNGGGGINSVKSIALDKLEAHPDNPNAQSKANFGKLVRNIERTGRYEPLVVRPSPDKPGSFQIINGHHRCHALARLDYEKADCIVWNVDDEQTDILLSTLNRLAGRDQLAKKLKLLKRLSKQSSSTELAKLLPMKKKQIERLNSLLNSRSSMLETCRTQIESHKSKIFANPIVFFLDDKQQRMVEKALSLRDSSAAEKTKAARRAAALTHMAKYFIESMPDN